MENELGSNSGKLEAIQRQGQGEVGKLTDDDLTVVAGKRDQLAGILQKKYGFAKDQAEKELDAFTNGLDKA